MKKQARKPRSYASPKLCPLNDLLNDLLTGVKCRATSVAKKRKHCEGTSSSKAQKVQVQVHGNLAVTQAGVGVGKQDLRLAASYWQRHLGSTGWCLGGGGEEEQRVVQEEEEEGQGVVGDQSRSQRRSQSPTLGTS